MTCRQSAPPAHALLVAIRGKCLDCCGNNRREVERCKIRDCALHPYRSISALGEHGEDGREEIAGQMDMFGAGTNQ